MEPIDFDELDPAKGRPSAQYKRQSWRPKIGRRMLERAELLVSWFRLTVWPRYGWRVLASVILTTCGRLGDAAAFVVGIHILTGAVPEGILDSGGLQDRLILVAVGIACIIAVASLLGYAGNKLAVRIALAYQDICFADGLAILRFHRDNKIKLSNDEINSITRQAPRMMARSLMQIVNLGTSSVITLAGLGICITVFPVLTLLILLTLLLLSPLYIVAALHSTNIGHSFRLSAPAFGVAVRRIERKWLDAESFQHAEALNDIWLDENYGSYQTAYGGRLALSAWNRLLSNVTLAFVVALSLTWIAYQVELTANSVAAIVSYLISLRLFAHGLAGFFSGMQSINTNMPFFLGFLSRDPRFKRKHTRIS